MLENITVFNYAFFINLSVQQTEKKLYVDHTEFIVIATEDRFFSSRSEFLLMKAGLGFPTDRGITS